MELMVKMGVQGTSISQAVAALKTQLQKERITVPVAIGPVGGGGTPENWGAPGKRQSFADWQRGNAVGSKGIGQRLAIGGSMFTSVARDSAASLATGAPVTQIIAQQAPQVLQALAMMRLGWVAIAIVVLGAWHYMTKWFADGISGASAMEKSGKRLQEQLDKLHGAMEKLRSAQKGLSDTSAKSVFENATPEQRLKITQAAAVTSADAVRDAAKKRNDAAEQLAGMTSGAIRNQLTGERYEASNPARVAATADLAKAEEDLATARKKNIEAMDAYHKANDAVLEKDLEANKKKKEAAADAFALKDQRPSFQADSLAQAGLFAGSSLLLNPDFSLEQEQLNVLRSIDSKVGANPFT